MINDKQIVDNINNQITDLQLDAMSMQMIPIPSFYKDSEIPSKPTIIIDSREKDRGAYSFNDNLFNSLSSKLETGDYSLLGLSSQIVTVERKSFPDYVKTVIHDWERFSAELKRMGKFRYKAIIIEYGLPELFTECYKHYYADDNLYQKVSCNSLIGKALYIQQQYDIPVYWLDNRGLCIMWLEKYFFQIWERYKKNGMAGLRMVK